MIGHAYYIFGMLRFKEVVLMGMMTNIKMINSQLICEDTIFINTFFRMSIIPIIRR